MIIWLHNMFGFFKRLKTKRLAKKLQNRLFLKPPTYNVDPGYMYMDIYGEFPIYKYSMEINREDEDENFDIYDVIFKDLVKTGKFEVINYEYNKEAKKDEDDVPHSVNEPENKEKTVFVDRFYLAKIDEPVLIGYEYGSLMIYSHLSVEKLEEIYDTYIKQYDQDDNNVKCYVVVKDPQMYLDSFNIKMKDDLDFDLYNEGFEEVHKNIVKSIKEDKNGLYLFYGDAGTGKTTYIRHLIKECGTEKRKFVYVPGQLFESFTDPTILPFLFDHRGCVYIIEDCENLVTVDDGVRSDSISDLLNMTDGLLSDALDIKIICTFNTDYDKIDDALLRPGRCRCKYEFELLDKSRANKVAKKLGLKKVDKDVSLAELFNPELTFTNQKKHKKIGF